MEIIANLYTTGGYNLLAAIVFIVFNAFGLFVAYLFVCFLAGIFGGNK